ncbi:MAG: methyltransferase domain-containing protein [Anaerolineales bacterium]|nr:methyltransferase domain-containing protein [Anaerolineales bacterium]
MKDLIGKFLLDWRKRVTLPLLSGRLLDIGCGTNELVREYPGPGIGVDVYDWGDVDLVVKDTSRLPFKAQEFDTITIIAALNHIPNREEVLAEAKRVLKEDGKIIITMLPPFISKIWHILREPWDIDQAERGMKAGEVYGLTHKETLKLLKDAGFRVVYEKLFMFGINRLTIADKADFNA